MNLFLQAIHKFINNLLYCTAKFQKVFKNLGRKFSIQKNISAISSVQKKIQQYILHRKFSGQKKISARSADKRSLLQKLFLYGLSKFFCKLKYFLGTSAGLSFGGIPPTRNLGLSPPKKNFCPPQIFFWNSLIFMQFLPCETPASSIIHILE